MNGVHWSEYWSDRHSDSRLRLGDTLGLNIDLTVSSGDDAELHLVAFCDASRDGHVDNDILRQRSVSGLDEAIGSRV